MFQILNGHFAHYQEKVQLFDDGYFFFICFTDVCSTFFSGRPYEDVIFSIINHKENVNYAQTTYLSFSFYHIGSSSTPLFSHHPSRHFNDVAPWLRRRSSDFVSFISGHPSRLHPPPPGHYPVPVCLSLPLSPVTPLNASHTLSLSVSVSLFLSLMTDLLTLNLFTSICPSAHTRLHTSPLSKFPCGPSLHVPGYSSPPMERPMSARSLWRGCINNGWGLVGGWWGGTQGRVLMREEFNIHAWEITQPQ